MAASYGLEESIALKEDLSKKGVVKSNQAELLQRREISGFTINVRRQFEVHGFLDGASSKPASLLVLQFQLFNENKSRTSRFKYFQPILRFERDPKINAPDDPTIVSFGPGQKGSVILSESTAKQTEATSVQGNVSGQLPGTSLGGQVSYSNTFERNRPYYYKASGNSKKSTYGGRLGEDVVQWTLEEDANTKVGVDDITVFVLVKRPDKSNFVIHLDTKATVNSRYWLTEKYRHVKDWASLRKDEDYTEEEFDGIHYKPLKFIVTESPTPVPVGVVADKLQMASKENLLDGLAYLHVPRMVSSGQVHQPDSQISHENIPKQEEEKRDDVPPTAQIRDPALPRDESTAITPPNNNDPDDVLSDDGDQDDILSDDVPSEPDASNGGFNAAQKDYIHALIGACSLYHRAQKELWRECNKLRKLDAIPPEKVKEVKKFLSDVRGQTELAEIQLRPFARTRNLILNQEFKVESKVRDASDIDQAVFPVPFPGAKEDANSSRLRRREGNWAW